MDTFGFVGWKVVHDVDIAGQKGGYEHLIDTGPGHRTLHNAL